MVFLELAPVLIAILSFISGMVFLTNGFWWPALYWFAATLLNVAVIFGMR
jgi:hypothetical protein